MTALASESWRRRPSAQVRYGRAAALAFAVLLHLSILLFFLRPHPAVVAGSAGAGVEISLAGLAPRPIVGAIKVVEAAPPPTPRPTALLKARSVPDAPVDTLTAAPVVAPATPVIPVLDLPVVPELIEAAAAASSGAPGPRCAVLDSISAVFQSDPAAHEALLRIPRPQRSVANAVLLWDGQWADPRLAGGPGTLIAIETAIQQVIAAAQPDCRDESLVGPRLIVISEPAGAMILVLGSGLWRWTDLMPQDGALPGTPRAAD